MSDFDAEALSALMDSEAEELEVRRLLAHVESDSEIRARWCRYHTARSVLQKEQSPYAHIDISAAVREQVENESQFSMDSELTPEVKSGGGAFSFKPLAGLAVAASVTAMVFFGAQGLNNSASPNALPELVEESRTALPSVREVEQERVATANFEAAERLRKQRMQTYMQLHAQHASMNIGQGMLPMARVTNHEVE